MTAPIHAITGHNILTKKVKKTLADRRKLNTIKRSIDVRFANKTILHWQAGRDLGDLSTKIQPSTKQKRSNKL